MSGKFALVLHGGAGAIPLDTPDERKQRIYSSLRRILAVGREALEAGESALDVVEKVVRELEDDELYNAGKGAVMNELGEHELDASIMDGATMQCGAVGGVTSPRNPVTLARRVMEDSRHVFLQGAGADRFARRVGVEQVAPTYFTIERRKQQLELAKQAEADHVKFEDPEKGTVGCVALDQEGHLAAATSTGGRTNKRVGRVGDSPIIGAGNYANGRCAISCTGTGEEFIRYTVARDVAARVEFLGETASQAAEHMIRDVLKPGDGGIIAVDIDGRVSMPFSTQGMFRGYLDGTGQCGVGIWEELQPGD
jgi:beta-aspartyl-peptidase (threonine type)